jgi:hypothetical protein
MPNFNSDVVIDAHDLRLVNATGDEVARIDQDGNLVVLREFAGALHAVLDFVGLGAQLSVGAAVVPGVVRLLSSAGEAILLRASDATIALGGGGQAGDLVLSDTTGQPIIVAHGASATVDVGSFGNDGEVTVNDSAGRAVIRLQATNAAVYAGASGNEGDVLVADAEGRTVIHADGGNAALYVGTEGNEGDIIVRDGIGNDVMHMDGNNAALYIGAGRNEGDLIIRDSGGRQVFHLDGNSAALYIGANGNEGDIRVRDSGGRDVFSMDGATAAAYLGADGNEGDLFVRDGDGRNVIHLNGSNAAIYVGASGNEGDVIVRNSAGDDTIHLDGNSGDIRLMGADLAEEFTAKTAIEPGSVVVALGPDEVAVSDSAVDRRVIGVASGAGSLHPALRLGSRPGGPHRAEWTRVPVALVGRVYCKADADHGAIAAGDLLTSSDIAGHAMRVEDPATAAGAIIGKALGPLSSGRGLVPVVLTLQ